MSTVNPYQSPVACGPHRHKMPTWLKRFVATVVSIAVIIAFYDAIYLHRLQVSSPRFEGWSSKKILNTWIEEEIYGKTTNENH